MGLFLLKFVIVVYLCISFLWNMYRYCICVIENLNVWIKKQRGMNYIHSPLSD